MSDKSVVRLSVPGQWSVKANGNDLGWTLGEAVGMTPAGARQCRVLSRAIICVFDGNNYAPLGDEFDKALTKLVEAAREIEYLWEKNDKDINERIRKPT